MAPQSLALSVKEGIVEIGKLHVAACQILSAPVDFDKTYQNFFVMDVDLINSRDTCTCLGGGRDLYSAVQECIEESKREEFVKNSIAPVLIREGKAFEQAVSLLLDEELRSYGRHISEERDYSGKEATLMTKGQLIAEYRMEKNIVRTQRPKTRSFLVNLQTLVKGDGRFCNSTTLYFYFDCPFEDFLSTLQQETNCCALPGDNSPAADGLGISELTISTHSSVTSDKSVSDNFHTNNTAEKTPATTPRVPQKTTNSASRGFTLEHGPWVYCIHLSRDKWAAEHQEIWDKRSYEEMIAALKELKEPCVYIIHSFERRAQENWKKQILLELDDLERRREEFKGLDVWGDGDTDANDVGQSYTTWSVEVLTRKVRYPTQHEEEHERLAQMGNDDNIAAGGDPQESQDLGSQGVFDDSPKHNHLQRPDVGGTEDNEQTNSKPPRPLDPKPTTPTLRGNVNNKRRDRRSSSRTDNY